MTYEVAFLAEPGCEPYVEQEVTQKTTADPTRSRCNTVIATLEKHELIRMLYTGQTINNAFLRLTENTFTTQQDILDHAQEIDTDRINRHLQDSYKVVANRQGDHDFNSVDLEKNLYDTLKDDIDSESDIHNPDSLIHIEVRQDEFLIGLKLTKKDLKKRNYKVFNTRESLRATIAASFLYFSKHTSDKKCIDPFSTAGTIMIEAALKSSNKPVRFYTKELIERILLPDFSLDNELIQIDDEEEQFKGKLYSFDAAFKNLSTQKKNSKIAGVHDYLTFSRVSALDADLKFEKDEIDLVMTKLPEVTKRRTKEDVDELYDLMIYRFEYILKDDCRFCVISKNSDHFTEKAKLYGFEKTREKRVNQGELDLSFTEYQR